MDPIRILSIDGGGMRGVIPARFLLLLENRLNAQRTAKGLAPKRLHEYFDLIAGTSTGGLIGVAMTVPAANNPIQPRFTFQDILNIYLQNGERIFPKPGIMRKLKGYVFGGETLYDPSGLEAVLKERMDGVRLNQSIKPLLITSYDIFNNEPRFFKTREAKSDPMENFALTDICRCTSAGPTYFPPHNFVMGGKTFNCIDGGVFINNPAVGALAEFIRHGKFYAPDKTITDTLSNVFVLSLSTGRYSGNLSISKSQSMSAVKWIQPLIDIMMYGVNQTTDYELKQVLPSPNYFRFNVDVTQEKYSAMDNGSADALAYWDKLANDQFAADAAYIDAFLTASGMTS
ncbi:MAG: patatin-like phospholipase family protein [Bacteroidia bacterium]